MNTSPGSVLRVGNCSGFYGDRLSAMREMLEGSSDGAGIDVVTGDYLAELTMLILGKDTMRDSSLGFARTFVRQVEDCLGLALERGVRIVSNAGGLNPAGLADKLREVARGLGLAATVAHVEGDDLRPLALWPDALTANAYLGGFGIASALSAGADIVVTGRVTDASLVVGAAVAHHGWEQTAYDELAGAVVAGHVLECGTQATGGNFSGFLTLPERSRPLGFPLAEIAADGSCVITKQDGTGGAVTVDTVTAQLLYEIQSARYLGPDVTTHLDTIALGQQGPDRVLISGVRGEAPPPQLKVCVNELGGFRNQVEFVLTGLDVEAKGEWVREQLTAVLGDEPPAEVFWSPIVAPPADSPTAEDAATLLRCIVKDPLADAVGKRFTAATVELALGSYPGFTMTAPPAAPTAYGVFRAEYVDRDRVEHVVVHADGSREVVADPPAAVTAPVVDDRVPTDPPEPEPDSLTVVPLGTFVHARSGDKGGDANLGLWVTHGEPGGPDSDEELYAERVRWLCTFITAARVRELIPEAAGLDIEVVALPNLGGVNVLIRRLLGDGVAASTRFDPQAKALGEWARSRHVAIERGLL